MVFRVSEHVVTLLQTFLRCFSQILLKSGLTPAGLSCRADFLSAAVCCFHHSVALLSLTHLIANRACIESDLQERLEIMQYSGTRAQLPLRKKLLPACVDCWFRLAELWVKRHGKGRSSEGSEHFPCLLLCCSSVCHQQTLISAEEIKRPGSSVTKRNDRNNVLFSKHLLLGRPMASSCAVEGCFFSSVRTPAHRRSSEVSQRLSVSRGRGCAMPQGAITAATLKDIFSIPCLGFQAKKKDPFLQDA